jgi:hypothetical protein
MAKKKSLTIIDNIAPKASAFTYEPPPTFRTKLEMDRYYAEEKRRWIEGYSEDINGYHYFYLTQCKIKSGNTGALIRPFWRDCDTWIFQDFAKAREMRYKYGLISRREIGKTSIGAAGLTNYFMRVYPGSKSLMTSCDKDRIQSMFKDKTIPGFMNLDEAVRGEVVSKKESKNDMGLIGAYSYRDEDGTITEAHSEIMCKETVDKPSGFSGQRAIYGYYDEFALHPHSDELLRSSEPCYKVGTETTGTLMWAGTVELETTMEAINKLRNIVADSKDSKTLITFAPFWWGMSGPEVPFINGHSNKKAAEIWREKEIERLEKLEDKNTLRAFEKNYPSTLEEALGTAIEGTLPKECMAIIERQRIEITKNKPAISKYSLIEDEDCIEATPDNKNGVFNILTLPEPGNEYICGIDPIPFGDKNIGDGSAFCITVYEYHTDTIVAYYKERNLNADVVFNNCYLLQCFYNDARAMLEMNRGEVLYQKYVDNGLKHLLCRRPTTLGVKFTEKRMAYGYNKGEKLGAIGNSLLIKYILEHGHNIYFKELLQEMEMYLKENTDFLDAFIACLIGLEDKTKKAYKAIPRVQYIERRVLKRDSKGRTYFDWEKVQIIGQE